MCRLRSPFEVSEFDSRKNAWATADAGLVQAQARVAQAKGAERFGEQACIAGAWRISRALPTCCKRPRTPRPMTVSVTNLPVREGESVVIGYSECAGSTLMTIANMSVPSPLSEVDETDIVNVHLGQPAEVTIDAISKENFSWTVWRWR